MSICGENKRKRVRKGGKGGTFEDELVEGRNKYQAGRGPLIWRREAENGSASTADSNVTEVKQKPQLELTEIACFDKTITQGRVNRQGVRPGVRQGRVDALTL
jgi:hypothetical protein